MTLADTHVGEVVVLLATHEPVEVEVVNACRVRVRALRWTDHTFTNTAGHERRVHARAKARDLAPSAPCVPTMGGAMP